MLRTSLVVATSRVALMFAAPRPAAACSVAAPCPEGPSLFPSHGDVPANLPGLRVGLPRGELSVTANDIPVSLADGTLYFDEVPPLGVLHFEVERTLSVDEEQPAHCPDEVLQGAATLSVRESAPFPTELGVLSWRRQPTEQVVVFTGECTNDVPTEGLALFSTELSEEARPWADALVWETVVDGSPRSQTFASVNPQLGRFAWRPGRGVDEVRADCDTGATREVRMRATIPGSDVVIETNAVHLTCAEIEAMAEPAAGTDPALAAGAGCAAAEAPPRTAALLLLVALVALRRRR